MSAIGALTSGGRAETGLLLGAFPAASIARESWEEPDPPVFRLSRRASLAAAVRKNSYLAEMERGSARISQTRQAELGLLLGAAFPLSVGTRSFLQPIWADEGMQRGYDMVRLIAALEHAVPCAGARSGLVVAEYGLAAELAAAYRSLDFVQDTAMSSCSEVLRTAVRDLVELFGPTGGSPRLCMAVDHLALPMFQRRALVLAACHLVTDALCRTDRRAELIVVSLTRVTKHIARLRVAGAGRSTDAPDDTVADLASLLESEPVYVGNGAGSVSTEITFPTHDAAPPFCGIPQTEQPDDI
jgi:hypothetical protein